jgi:hypothetical protein
VRADQAREVAAGWVAARAHQLPGFRGAFLSGSLPGLSDEEDLPATSDVDLTVVLAGREVPPKPGKLARDGVLLEVTYLPEDQLDDVDVVARTYYLAPSFRGGCIVSDPTGRLAALERAVAEQFGRPDQVRARCADVLLRVEHGLRAVTASSPWHDEVTSWLFPASLTTQVVLVATGLTPTVRRRYLRARQVLDVVGRPDVYARLLELIGCAHVDGALAQHHLDRMAAAFDRAAAVARTRFAFSNDVTADARPVAVDGSQELIDSGDAREAVFWIVATFARCQKILAADAPDLERQGAAGFADTVQQLLGLDGPAALLDRRRDNLESLGEWRATAEALIAG